MKMLEFGNRTSAVVRERPFARAAIVIGIGSILLLAMLIPTLAPARANDKNTVHVTGTFMSYFATPFIATYTVTHGSTTTALSNYDIVSDDTETGSSGHGELLFLAISARDTGSNSRVVTAIATYSGTVGNSQPGIFSAVVTYTVDYSNPSNILSSGRETVIQGSGQGGLEGICGGGTFQVQVTSPPTPGTYDDTYHFGASCASNSQGN